MVKNIETLASNVGFDERFSKTIDKISERRNLVREVELSLENWSEEYKETLSQFKALSEDPVEFYQKNKKIRATDNDLLTYGSLSLSYSFCSPYCLARDIIRDAKNIRGYHELMLETSDNNHDLEDFDDMILSELRDERRVKRKYSSLVQDLRGNKVPPNLVYSLLEKVDFEKRPKIRDLWGFGKINQECLIDSFYIFFGSKRGSDFVERWKQGENKETLKDEFEYLVYNSPYVNPVLVDSSFEDFMSERHTESAEEFIKRNKNLDLRQIRTEGDDFEFQ